MFDESARYYDRFYDFLDYAAAADALRGLISRHHPGASSLLDVACGTGRYVEHLHTGFRDIEGLDIEPRLLEQARRRDPGVRFHEADMTDFALGRRFDVVTCLFCSIAYVRTLERARDAIACMAAHLKPGGVLIMEPWIAPENCWTDRINCEVHDAERDLKIVRMHTYERTERTSVYDIHYLIGTPHEVRHFVEREELGLFTRDEYARALTDCGLEASYEDLALFPGHRYGVHIGRRPIDPR